MTERTSRRLPVLVAAMAAVVATSSCTTSGVWRSTSIEMISPTDGDRVGLPTLVEWEPVDGASAYAVVVDRAPMAPGDDVSSFGDEPFGVFVTDDTSLILGRSTIDQGRSRAQRHEVVVVPLDADGNRMGETTGRTRFTAGGES